MRLAVLRFEVLRVAVLRFCGVAGLLPGIFGPTLLYKASAKQDYIGLLPDSASDRSQLSRPSQKKNEKTPKSPCRPSISPAEGFFLPKTPPIRRGGACPARRPSRNKVPAQCAAGRMARKGALQSGPYE